MKTRKTKKRNIIRRTVAFLLCMTMVLGLGMQDVIEQVYAEGLSAVSQEQSAPETQNVESTAPTTPEEETDPTASGEIVPVTPEEEPTAPEEDKEPTEPSNPADTEENTDVTTPPTETTEPSAPEEPTTPADGTTNTDPTDPAAPETPVDSNGSEPSGETTPGESTGTDEQEPPVEEVPTDPAETTGEEETPEEELPEEEKTYEAEQKVDNVTIHVSAEAGVLPEDAELSVTPIVKTEITEEMSEEDKAVAEEINAQYDKTEQKLTEELEAETKASAEASVMSADALSAESAETGVAEEMTGEKVLEGFLAYDICFFTENENGELTEVEPDGEVNVTFEFEEAAMPDGVSEDAEIAVAHLKEDDSAEDGIRVENMTAAETAIVETAENAAVTKVELKTESFSVFTITWIREEGEQGEAFEFTSNIYPVIADAEGYRELEVNDPNVKITATGTPPTLYIDTIAENGNNNELYEVIATNGGTTYRFVRAFIAKYSNGRYELLHDEPVEALQALEKDVVRYKLKDAGEYTALDNNNERVIFVYTGDAATTTADYYTMSGEKINENEYVYTQIGNAEEGVWVAGNRPDGASAFIRHDGDLYKYAYTEIIKGGQTIEPNRMRYYENRLQYSLSDNDTESSEIEWLDVGIAEIRLIYQKNNTVTTVDTSGVIDISLTELNYDNSDTRLVFNKGNGSGSRTPTWNKWTGYSSFRLDRKDYNARNLAVQGIVEDNLYINANTPSTAGDNYTGYPKVKVSGNGDSWLEPLFSADNNTYTGLNHLFQIDTDGYYVYNSAENYAYFDKENGNKNFVVYNIARNKGGEDKDGDFIPFDDIDENYNSEDNVGTSGTDFEFSMNIGFNFTQPKDGKVNEKDMIFSFSGDDDVWVFIDGKLVLDIGGIHDAVSGTINFASGEISVLAGEEVHNNSYNTAYNGGDPVALDTSGTYIETTTYLSEIFDDLTGDTFEDGTTHRLEFFYLERGAGESNCSLRFNLQPQESQTIEVEKQITNTDKEKYANVEFDFKVFLENSEDSGVYEPIPQGTEYTLKRNGEVVGTGTVGENGRFTLKHGESAVFSGISPSLQYYVQEVSVSSDEFDQVMVNDKAAQYFDQDNKPITPEGGLITDQDDYIASTTEFLVGKVGKVVFGNRCSSRNLRELQITKVMEGNVEVTDKFHFRVWLENVAGEMELYEGPYYLKKDNVNYYYDNTGNLQPYDPGTKDQTCGNVENGEIRNVPVGYTVAITQILSGTSFKIEEYGYDENVYDNPTITVEEGTYTEDGRVTGSLGEIILGEDAKITVTNKLKSKITVNKVWNTAAGVELPQSIYVGLYRNGTPVSNTEPVELSEDNRWTATFAGVGGAEYSVKELRPVIADETPEFTIDDVGYIGVDDGAMIEFNNWKYTVDYALVNNSNNQGQWDATITNTQSWQIVKRSSSENNPVQPGAVFELTGPSESGTSITLTGTSREGGVITWTKDGVPYKEVLENGTYTLKETQAPAGFSIGADWTITIVKGIPTNITSNDIDTIGDGNGTSVTNGDAIFWNQSGTLTLYYDDDALVYELPKAGGPGIHLYMLGGTLLMMAGALLVYKKRKEEVLRS